GRRSRRRSNMLRKLIVAVPIAALAIGGSSACATKKFVRTSVGEVNDKVDSMGRSLEETQERTRRNEGRITEVDQKAQAAAQSAQQANDAATTANSAANAASSAAKEGDTKIESTDRAGRRWELDGSVGRAPGGCTSRTRAARASA